MNRPLFAADTEVRMPVLWQSINVETDLDLKCGAAPICCVDRLAWPRQLCFLGRSRGTTQMLSNVKPSSRSISSTTVACLGFVAQIESDVAVEHRNPDLELGDLAVECEPLMRHRVKHSGERP